MHGDMHRWDVALLHILAACMMLLKVSQELQRTFLMPHISIALAVTLLGAGIQTSIYSFSLTGLSSLQNWPFLLLWFFLVLVSVCIRRSQSGIVEHSHVLGHRLAYDSQRTRWAGSTRTRARTIHHGGRRRQESYTACTRQPWASSHSWVRVERGPNPACSR
jgi:hypothetical protein